MSASAWHVNRSGRRLTRTWRVQTVEVIGTKVRKSPAYVLGRLKPINLIATVQKVFYEPNSNQTPTNSTQPTPPNLTNHRGYSMLGANFPQAASRGDCH